MSLPRNLMSTFDPEEIQFLVENEFVKIMPRISTRQKRRNISSRNNTTTTQWKLITVNDHNINNMVVMNSTEVSLWLALLLKQQNKCSIIAPSWLTLKEVEKFIEFELRNSKKFAKLPWNWLVIAKLLFQHAGDDFKDPVHLLRTKVQDLREVRQGKIAKGLQYLNESHLQLENLSLLEINEMRPLVIGIMDKMKEIHATTAAENSG